MCLHKLSRSHDPLTGTPQSSEYISLLTEHRSQLYVAPC